DREIAEPGLRPQLGDIVAEQLHLRALALAFLLERQRHRIKRSQALARLLQLAEEAPGPVLGVEKQLQRGAASRRSEPALHAGALDRDRKGFVEGRVVLDVQQLVRQLVENEP